MFGSVIDLRFFTRDLSSLEITNMSNKTVVIGGGGGEGREDQIKSKLTLILAREELHDHTLIFNREIYLKA